MLIRQHLASVALLGLLLAGCGSGGDTSAAPAPTSINPSTPAGAAAKIVIPTGGGTVTLPSTAHLTATATFAAGAAPNTELTLSVSETPPPNAPPNTTAVASGLSRSGFFWINLSTNQPFDLGLLTSLNLKDELDDVTAVPLGGEQYRLHVHESTGTLVQEVPGVFDPRQGVATFNQPRKVMLQPNSSYVVQADVTQHNELPLKLVNNSGINPAYITIVGQNPDPPPGGDPNYYYVNKDGQLVAMQPEDRIPSTVQPLGTSGAKYGYCDYTIPYPENGNLTLPMMDAARAFTSLGDKLLIRTEDPLPQVAPSPDANGQIPLTPVQPRAKLVQPVGWVNTDDPNYKVLWDWVEFVYTIDPNTKKPGMNINKTEVDVMGFGIQINLTGPSVANGSVTVGTTADGRAEFFKALEADPTFKSLLIAGPGKGGAAGVKWLRAVAPYQGINNKVNVRAPGLATFDENYWNQYITDVFSRYTTDTLTAFTSAFGTYTAKTVDDKLVWSRPGFPDITVRKPTTAEAFEPTSWQSGGACYSPTPGASPVVVPPPPKVVPSPGADPALFTPFVWSEIASSLSAGFNRSTLLRENFITRDYVNHPATLGNFYQTTDNTGKAQPINLYAYLIHKHALPTPNAPGSPRSGGAAYAFGFDDNSNQSSFIAEHEGPTSMTLTIMPIGQ